LHKLLLLTDQQVESLLTMAQAIEAVEQAFRQFGEGEAQMPAKVYLDFPDYQGDLRVMPAAIGTTMAGVKIVNSHPGNPARGLPAVMGTYLLVSQETGRPLAFMSATALTAIRTGAASAVATKYLALKEATTLGLVGAGVQAAYQLEAIMQVRDLSRVVVWGPPNDEARRDAFIARALSQHAGLRIEPAASIEDALSNEIICTTTPTRVPIVPVSAVSPGVHINAVGADAPGKQELDPQILRKAVVVVDEMHQAVSGGEINVPIANAEFSKQDIAATLSDLVTGKVIGRSSDEQITVFDSTGLAIEDIAVASLVYLAALNSSTGSEVEL